MAGEQVNKVKNNLHCTLGFAILRLLAKQGNMIQYLTSSKNGRGRKIYSEGMKRIHAKPFTDIVQIGVAGI